jgi:hypothetical protein
MSRGTCETFEILSVTFLNAFQDIYIYSDEMRRLIYEEWPQPPTDLFLAYQVWRFARIKTCADYLNPAIWYRQTSASHDYGIIAEDICRLAR